MKNMLLTFSAAWLLILVGSIANAGPTITNAKPTTFPNCEFKVFFPTKTQQKTAYANGMESVIVQSVYDGEGPFMRAECLPLSEPNETIAALRPMLENQARMSGIQNAEITIEKNKLGMIGTYAGERKAGGFDIKFFGKVVVGSRSLLSLLTSEEVEKFPSDKTIFFLNTVERK